MSNVLDEYLKTYNPDCTEYHSDSSDFEGPHYPQLTFKMSRHNPPLNKSRYPKRQNDPMFHATNSQTHQVSEDTSKSTWGSVTTSISQNGSAIHVQKSYRNKEYKIIDCGDKIETIQSKRSVIRHKVIPCISSIFRRPSNIVKQMSIIKENPVENVNIDNGCQATRVNREHKIRKFNRRQQYYAAQPVYAVEGNIHGNPPSLHSTTIKRTKIVREPLTTCKAVGNGNSGNCSLTSSSEEVDTRRYFKKRKGKRKKPKHDIVESGIGKEYFERYEGQGLRHIEQQYPAKMSPVPPNPYPINVAPTQYHQPHQRNAGCGAMAGSVNGSAYEIGNACSGFWEYIVNKINLKMQPQIKLMEGCTNTSNTLPPTFKPCLCSDTVQSSDCCCHNCPLTPTSQPSTPTPLQQGTSACTPPSPPKQIKSQWSPQKLIPQCSPQKLKPQCSPQNIKPQCSPQNIKPQCSPQKIKPVCSPQKVNQCPAQKKKKKKEKVHCRCPAQKCPATRDANVGSELARPCQLNHDKVTESLSQKYNGEILCIHNPPCVLINGCLNIPQPNTEVPCTTDLYSVRTDLQHNRFGYDGPQKNWLKRQQNTQYHCPSYEKQHRQDACCQCLTPTMEVKSIFNNMKNESCQYQIPHLLKRLMCTNHGIHYHSSPIARRQQQQTTDDESNPEMQKHQATDVDGYNYWFEPNELGTHEMCTPECCQYKSSPAEINKSPLTSDNSHEKIQTVNKVKENKPKRLKQEKKIQSICPHNPPCEIVRTCCKTKIDPKLQISCVHVPMCENVPLCLMELKNRYQNITGLECPHKPRCTEVPVCTRNYIVLTAKEEVATQVRPKTKMVCRHEPPCIMIPTCLAKVCDSCIPYDSIPACNHQPMCEMIPACCRKSAKEMVSFRSQYPKHSIFGRWKIH